MGKKSFLSIFGWLIVGSGVLSTLHSTASESPADTHKYLSYRFQPHDEIGRVLNQFGVCPLWGEGHRVQQMVELNHLNSDEIHKIRPGTVLKLPVQSLDIDPSEYKIVFDREDHAPMVVRLTEESKSYCKSGQVPFRAVKDETGSLPVTKKSEPKSNSKFDSNGILSGGPDLITPGTSSNGIHSRSPADQGPWGESSIGIAAELAYFGIRSVDNASQTPTTILSKISPGISAYWDLKWNSHFRTIAQFTYQHYDLEPFTSVKTLQNASGSRYGFSFLGREQISDRFAALAGFGAFEEIFNHASSTSVITIDPVAIPFLQARIDYEWYRAYGIHFGTQGFGKYYFSKTTDLYQIKSGTSFGLDFYLRHELNRIGSPYFQLDVIYQHRNQNTSLIQNADDAITAGFTYGFGVGERSEP